MRNREWRRIPSSVGDGLPALDVFWFYRRRPVTDLNLVKAARAAMIWRRFAWPDKLHIISHYSRWLFWFPKKAVLHLRSDGRRLVGDTVEALPASFWIS